tara:strand:- start:104 stop:526 length:423 start_codon:yes stop_codon:yes gene_type:complete
MSDELALSKKIDWTKFERKEGSVHFTDTSLSSMALVNLKADTGVSNASKKLLAQFLEVEKNDNLTLNAKQQILMCWTVLTQAYYEAVGFDKPTVILNKYKEHGVLTRPVYKWLMGLITKHALIRDVTPSVEAWPVEEVKS